MTYTLTVELLGTTELLMAISVTVFQTTLTGYKKNHHAATLAIFKGCPPSIFSLLAGIRIQNHCKLTDKSLLLSNI